MEKPAFSLKKALLSEDFIIRCEKGKSMWPAVAYIIKNDSRFKGNAVMTLVGDFDDIFYDKMTEIAVEMSKGNYIKPFASLATIASKNEDGSVAFDVNLPALSHAQKQGFTNLFSFDLMFKYDDEMLQRSSIIITPPGSAEEPLEFEWDKLRYKKPSIPEEKLKAALAKL